MRLRPRRRPRRHQHRRRVRRPSDGSRARCGLLHRADPRRGGRRRRVVDRIVGADRTARWPTPGSAVPGRARSSASASARRARSTRQRGDRAADAEPRLGQHSRCATGSRPASACPPRSTTTPTAPSLGEWWHGAARGARHAIGFTIGTGIGGGIILDGKLYHGASDVRRRDRPHDDRDERPALQVRQLRLPRGLRLGAHHRARAPSRRVERGRRELAVRRWSAATSSRSPRRRCTRRPHAGDALAREVVQRHRAHSSAPASPTCSTSSIPRWWSSAAA